MYEEEEESSGWQLTESDPGVFTELLKSLKVPLIVDDLYSLDADSLAALQPIHALIFLFKWVAGSDESGGGEGVYDEGFEGFFAHQVVNNACATLAVLNGICNIPQLEMGSELEELIAFTTGMDPQTRGLAITSSPFLRSAHNALSPPSAVSLDGLVPPSLREKEDAYHFVVYLPYAGSLYEFDGLKRAPIKHGPYTESGEGWVGTARETIQKRIETYPPGSLHFNLQAIRSDPLPKMKTELESLRSSSTTTAPGGTRVVQLNEAIGREESKRRQWDFENSLRKHNHLGLIHALLLGLAKSGGLDGAREDARKAMRERREKADKKKKEGGRMEED